MLSSIFSSERGAIAASLVVFAVLFTGYAIAIPAAFPEGGDGTNQWQMNVIRAQRYVYGQQERPTVLVGSSLSARLDEGAIAPGCFKLATAGGSATTGLEVVRRSGRVPRVILVEANDTLLRGVDAGLLVSIEARGPLDLRRAMPVFRAEYQPVTLLHGFIRHHRGGAKDATGEGGARPANFEALLAEQKAAVYKKLEAEVADKKLADVEVALRDLMARGTRVLFFEPPVHPEVAAAPLMSAMRATLLRRFPPARYRWAPRSAEAFETTDGLHLTKGSARRYSRLLGEALAASGLDVAPAEAKAARM